MIKIDTDFNFNIPLKLFFSLSKKIIFFSLILANLKIYCENIVIAFLFFFSLFFSPHTWLSLLFFFLSYFLLHTRTHTLFFFLFLFSPFLFNSFHTTSSSVQNVPPQLSFFFFFFFLLALQNERRIFFFSLVLFFPEFFFSFVRSIVS